MEIKSLRIARLVFRLSRLVVICSLLMAACPYPEIVLRNLKAGLPIESLGRSLINTSVYPNPSVALKTALTSNGIYFTGTKAITGNGGTRVKLYAPAHLSTILVVSRWGCSRMNGRCTSRS